MAEKKECKSTTSGRAYVPPHLRTTSSSGDAYRPSQLRKKEEEKKDTKMTKSTSSYVPPHKRSMTSGRTLDKELSFLPEKEFQLRRHENIFIPHKYVNYDSPIYYKNCEKQKINLHNRKEPLTIGSYLDMLDEQPLLTNNGDIFSKNIMEKIREHPAYMLNAENFIQSIYRNFEVTPFEMAMLFFKHIHDIIKIYADYQRKIKKPFDSTYGIVFYNNTTLMTFSINCLNYEKMYILYNRNEQLLEFKYVYELDPNIPKIVGKNINQLIELHKLHQLKSINYEGKFYTNRNRSYNTRLIYPLKFPVLGKCTHIDGMQYQPMITSRKKTDDQLITEFYTLASNSHQYVSTIDLIKDPLSLPENSMQHINSIIEILDVRRRKACENQELTEMWTNF